MKRYIYLILFALVLVLPFFLRLAVSRNNHAPPAKARARLVIVTPHTQDIRREFDRAFNQWHQAKYGYTVALDYRTPGGTNDVKRLIQNTYFDQVTQKPRPNPSVDIDVVWGGGDFFFDVELKPLGVLQPIRIDPAILKEVFPQETLTGVRLLEGTKDPSGAPTPKWIGVCLSSFGIVYNPDLYKSLELTPPDRWEDLTDQKLAGLVALADPAHSGSAAYAYMMVIQRSMADAEETYIKSAGPKPTTRPAEWEKERQAAIARGWKKGMGTLLLIAANARYFTDSSSLVPNDVGNGNAAAGIAIDFYGRVYQESVGSGRCRVVLPRGATPVTPDPVAILAGVKGEQLELARRFVEFLLSRQGQLLWILKPHVPGGPAERALRRSPIRRDVYTDMNNWADQVNFFEEGKGFSVRAEWMGLFSDTRMLWAAAWIDAWDSLKDAYSKVLSVQDPKRRSELISRLADLPVTMQDVERIRDERKIRKADLEEWKARTRIEWTRRFQEHYRRIERDAR